MFFGQNDTQPFISPQAAITPLHFILKKVKKTLFYLKKKVLECVSDFCGQKKDSFDGYK